MQKLKSIIIIVDSREKQPWEFLPEEKKPGQVQIIGSEVSGLNAGDYSVVGMEDIVRIERKAGFRELFVNYSDKEMKERFEAEMERLRPIKHKYIIVDSVLSKDALSLSVPQHGFGPTGNRIIEWLTKIELNFGVGTIFAGDAGSRVAKTIFKEVSRKYGQ